MKDTSSGKSVLGGNALKLPDGGLHILRSEVNPDVDDILNGILDLEGRDPLQVLFGFSLALCMMRVWFSVRATVSFLVPY